MKIAILGNMNNNGFALMRYLRDLGCDAYLLLYKNDGTGALDHFKPECDSHFIDKWSTYIIQTSISNSVYHVLHKNIQKVIFQIYKKIFVINRKILHKVPNCDQEILNKLSKYDQIITSGYGPSILHSTSINITIFSPYSSGIEGVSRMHAPRWTKFSRRLLYEYGRIRQIKSLRKIGKIVIGDSGITKTELHNLNIPYIFLPIPMVYVESCNIKDINDEYITTLSRVIGQYDFTIMMHSRLAWSFDSCKRQKIRSKNNDWLLLALKSLIKINPNIRVKLFILEYGPDVKVTKDLICSLKLTAHVCWIKKTTRKNIMLLLSKVSVGVGEFINSPRTVWGGTGWEVFASYKPLIQGFKFKDGEFTKIYGIPEPPVLKVENKEDILKHLKYLSNNVNETKAIGFKSGVWFNKYNGYSCAKKWKNELGVF